MKDLESIVKGGLGKAATAYPALRVVSFEVLPDGDMSVIHLHGEVASFHLKQLAQVAVKVALDPVPRKDWRVKNEIHVRH